MTTLSQALTAALLHFVWQGIAVAFLLWVVLLAMRRRTAAERYAASCAALALMAALPILTCGAGLNLQRALARQAAATVASLPVAIHPLAIAAPGWLSQLRAWILPLWAAGVFLFAARLALSYRHVVKLRRAGEPADDTIAERVTALAHRMSIPRPVRVLVSRIADCPSVVGWLRPAILIPAAALAGLDPAQLEAILAHELAHIRRHDFLVNALQTVVETLLFYHPAVWWVSARIRHERELCCDDLAVLHCGDAVGYARALTRLERIRVMPQPALAANGASLFYRIQRLTGAVRECAPSRLPVILAVAAAAACLPLAVHRVHAQQAPRPVTVTDAAVTPATEMPAPELPATEAPRPTVQANSIVVPYPQSAIAQGITGPVLVEASLDGNGAVVDARVLTGPMELRKSALRAVLEWHAPEATDGEVRQVNVEFTQDALLRAKAMRDRRALEFQVDALDQQMDRLNKSLQTWNGQTPQELSDQMAALERALEQTRSTEQSEKTKEALASLVRLEKQLEDARQIYTEQHPTIRAIEKEARKRLEALESAQSNGAFSAVTDWAVGSKVVRIEGQTLPPGFASPVALGDVLTRQSIDAFTDALKTVNLGFQVIKTADGEVTVRIVPLPH